MPSLHFHSPLALWLLALLPIVFIFRMRNQHKRAALRFASNTLFSAQTRGTRARFLWLLPLFQMLSLFLAIVALARPQIQERHTRNHSVEGIDIMIVFDLSKSMDAADFKPINRINVAKHVLSEFIKQRRGNDRIGLVVFAGLAYTQVPLTLDYGILNQIVTQLKTGVIHDGTAIGDALANALLRLRKSEAKSKVIVLITDGDNNAGRLSPLDTAQIAASHRIPIYTILVGKGGKVPFPRENPLFGAIEWIEIEIPINPELLENVAATSGGKSYVATDEQSLKEGLQNALNAFERSKLLDGTPDSNYRELFGGFLLVAFLLLVIKTFLQNGPLRVLP